VSDPRDAEVIGALQPQAAPGPDGTGSSAPRSRHVRRGTPRGHAMIAGARLAAVPLRTRLVAILVVALLGAIGTSGYASQWLLRDYMTRQMDDHLRQDAQSAVFAAVRAVDAGDLTRPVPGEFFVQFWNGQGDTRVTVPQHSSGAERAEPDFPALPASAFAGGNDHVTIYTLHSTNGSGTWRAVSVVAALPGRQLSYTYAQVALPVSTIDAAVAWFRLFILLTGSVLIALVSALGWFAIRRSFRPLVEMEETAAAIAAGDLSRRIPERPASTEVGRLTRSLNGMLTQIESAFRSREASEARTRRFAADASHELRTPLVSIRGFAELFRQGAVPPDEVPRTMRRIEDEAKRMGSLVEDLLLLARLDEQRPGRHDPVDLAVLAGDAVHDAKGLDAARRVTLVGLDGHGPVPAVVVGDEDRLRQVVANLVANAVRHTPAGTPIEVAVGRDGAGALLEVRDHGAGLAPEQAQRVFERFYRVDASRRRDTGGGSGLGLSIVAAVVAAHAGRVEVLPTPGGGATFRVSLPSHGAALPEALDGPGDRTGHLTHSGPGADHTPR